MSKILFLVSFVGSDMFQVLAKLSLSLSGSLMLTSCMAKSTQVTHSSCGDACVKKKAL